jgi:DNA polymerase
MAARFGSTNRQAGKAAELGCGFQMGPDKFVTAAWDVYQVRVTIDEARMAVTAYRESHPHVKDLWWEIHNASIAAVHNAGKVFLCGALKNIKLVKLGSYLYIVLPSGRPLCYAAPRVVQEPPPWGGEPRDTLHYEGFETSPTGAKKQWGVLRTYGGHLVENIVQAVARDLIADAMLRIEATGRFAPILSVHDEAIAEANDDGDHTAEFVQLMTTLPAWAGGCPVTAEAWQGFRYRK